MTLSDSAKERIFDIIVEDMLKESCKQEIEEFRNDDREHDFPADFDRKVRKIRNSIGRSKAVKTAVKIVTRTAVTAASIMGIIFGGLLTQPNVSASVKDTINNIFDESDEFEFKNYANKIDKNDGITGLGYVPEGYVLVSSYVTPQNGTITYRSDTNKLVFEFFAQNHDMYSNNDYSKYISVKRNGQEYFYYSDTDYLDTCTLLWNCNGYSYSLYANLSDEELIKIAENIY